MMQQLCFMSGLTSSEWAAWVQAIGSITAIVAAIGVGWYQATKGANMTLRAIKHSEQLQIDQRFDRMAEAYAPALAITERAAELFDATRTRLIDLQASMDDPPPTIPVTTEHTLLMNAFRAIPPHQMPTYRGVLSVLKLREFMHDAEEQMVKLMEKHNLHHTLRPAELSSLSDAIQVLNSERATLRQEMIRAVNQLA
jgi:hypothetical protein